MKKISIAILLISSFGYQYNIFANDTAFGGQGALPIPIKNNQISMLSEHIIITGQNIDNQEGQWNVSCQYDFKSSSDSIINLQMGFPFPVSNEHEGSLVPAGKSLKIGQPLVHDFVITKDGKELPSKSSKISSDKKKDLYYEDAFLWQMKFMPKEKVTLLHRFTTGVTHDAEQYNWVSYVLKTGALWQGGVINHAVLEVIPNQPTILCTDINNEYDYIKPKPKGLQVLGSGAKRKYLWDLKQFQPKNDLSLCLVTAKNFIKISIIRKILNSYQSVNDFLISKNKKQLSILRNSIYAQYGRGFKNTYLQKYFSGQWWYTINDNYSDKMLNDNDREAIQKILKI